LLGASPQLLRWTGRLFDELLMEPGRLNSTISRVTALTVAMVSVLGCGPRAAPSERPWVEVTSRHFVVQSDLEAEEAKALALEFESSYAALRSFPFTGKDEPPGRTRVVVLESTDDYRAVAPPRSVGFYTSTDVGFDQWSSVVFSSDARLAGMEIFRHELTHRLVAHHLPAAPIWLNEGLAEVLSTARVEGNRVTYGDPPTAYQNAWTVLDLPSSSEVRALTNEEFRDRATQAYVGSWALVHVSLLGNGPNHDHFLEYLNHFGSGRASAAAAFELAFDARSLAELDKDYVDLARNALVTRMTGSLSYPVSRELTVQSLSSAAALRLWARLLLRQRSAQAILEAERSISLEPAAAEGYVIRANAESAREPEKAEVDLRRAVAAAPSDPAALRALGMFLLATKGKSDEVAGLAERLGPIARSASDFMFLASWELARGGTTRALIRAKRSVALDSACVGCYTALAAVYAAGQHWPHAAHAQEMAVNLAGERASRAMFERLTQYRNELVKQRAERRESPAN
jgi:hypothetical protein